MKKLSRPMTFTLAFAAIGLLWRLLFLPASQGSYTDGILQVDMFRQGLSYWPPLFALLARLFAWIPGLGLEGAGRLVALLAGAFVFFPLSALARRLLGMRAAIWTMTAWLVSPMALRWSLQGMTDMPATALWVAALAALTIAVENFLPGLFPHEGPVAPTDARRGNQWLLAASLCGALTTLTRYQGILLLPILVVAVWKLAAAARRFPGRSYSPWLTLLPWLAVPLWLARGAGSLILHGQQIQQRAGLLNYWIFFESFLLVSPYFVTYGLFGFLLYGLFRTNWATARLRWTGWIGLYLTLTILLAQSAFSSFQSRYLLPLLPLVCLFAGHGLATWERRQEKRALLFWGLVFPTLLWGLIFAALVAVLQGSPFADLKQASFFVRGLNLPPSVKIISNERYNEKIDTAKTSFWTGREVKLLGTTPPAPGDLIILSSYMAGGMENYYRLRNMLVQNTPARLKRPPFARKAWPLFPDIMQEAGTHQNPVAWHYRYQPQYFETTVLEVLPSPGSDPLTPIPPQPAGQGDAQTEKLKAVQKELEALREK